MWWKVIYFTACLKKRCHLLFPPLLFSPSCPFCLFHSFILLFFHIIYDFERPRSYNPPINVFLFFWFSLYSAISLSFTHCLFLLSDSISVSNFNSHPVPTYSLSYCLHSHCSVYSQQSFTFSDVMSLSVSLHVLLPWMFRLIFLYTHISVKILVNICIYT